MAEGTFTIDIENDDNSPIIDTLAHREEFPILTINYLRQQQITGSITASSTYEGVPNVVHVSSQLPINHDDSESVKGRFGWEFFGECHMPYIIRIINNEKIKFVPVRVAETHLLKKYLTNLNTEIYEATHVKSYFFTVPEAILFNSINKDHCNLFYGSNEFWAGKDIFVCYEDLYNFYNFLDVCYKTSICRDSLVHEQFCGFLKINSKYTLAYCIKDEVKYVPLFYFNDLMQIDEKNVVIINNWHLLYLKFCLRMQNISSELRNNDYCRAVRLDYVVEVFPSFTKFIEFWPPGMVGISTDCIQMNYRPAIWVRAPDLLHNNTSGNILPKHTLSAPYMVSPLGMPFVNSTHQNEQLSNQMGSVILQQNSDSMNNEGHIPDNALLIQVGVPSTSVVSPISHSNNVAVNQGTNAMCNTVNINNTISNSNQTLQQFDPIETQLKSNNSQVPQQQLNESVTTRSLQFYSSQSISANESEIIDLTSPPSSPLPQTSKEDLTHVNYKLKLKKIPEWHYFYGISKQDTLNESVTTRSLQFYSSQSISASESEIIDLTSPPSSPLPQTSREDLTHVNYKLKLKKIPEWHCFYGISKQDTLKMRKTVFKGKLFDSINTSPSSNSEYDMIILSDLVKELFPSAGVSRIANILSNYLNVTLFELNTAQLNVLSVNGSIMSLNPNDTPLVMLKDITSSIWAKLEFMVKKYGETHQECDQPKRPRVD